MRKWIRATCLLALLMCAGACSVLPGPKPMLPGCPDGYDLHVDTQMGFSSCYPSGWILLRGEEESGLEWVGFLSPAADWKTGNEWRLVLIKSLPSNVVPGDEFLLAAEELLVNNYGQKLLGLPMHITVDGQQAVEVSYIEEPGLFAEGVAKLTGWTVVFLANGKQWVIEVTGRSGYRLELEGVHQQVLKEFHILPRSPR